MDYFHIAKESFKKEEYPLAVEEYTNFINSIGETEGLGEVIREKVVEAYNDRGQAQYRQVHFFEAISDFTSAIRLNPEYSIAFYNRGLIHYRLGQYTLAIQDFEKTLQLTPEFRDASLAIATAKSEQAIDGDRPWPGYLERIKG